MISDLEELSPDFASLASFFRTDSGNAIRPRDFARLLIVVEYSYYNCTEDLEGNVLHTNENSPIVFRGSIIHTIVTFVVALVGLFVVMFGVDLFFFDGALRAGKISEFDGIVANASSRWRIVMMAFAIAAIEFPWSLKGHPDYEWGFKAALGVAILFATVTALTSPGSTADTIIAIPIFTFFLLAVTFVAGGIANSMGPSGLGDTVRDQQFVVLAKNSVDAVLSKQHRTRGRFIKQWNIDISQPTQSAEQLRQAWSDGIYIGHGLLHALPNRQFDADEYLMEATGDLILTSHNVWISEHTENGQGSMADYHKHHVRLHDVQEISVDQESGVLRLVMRDGVEHRTITKYASELPDNETLSRIVRPD